MGLYEPEKSKAGSVWSQGRKCNPEDDLAGTAVGWIERERSRGREVGRQGGRERQRARETERQRDIQAEREGEGYI